MFVPVQQSVIIDGKMDISLRVGRTPYKHSSLLCLFVGDEEKKSFAEIEFCQLDFKQNLDFSHFLSLSFTLSLSLLSHFLSLSLSPFLQNPNLRRNKNRKRQRNVNTVVV